MIAAVKAVAGMTFREAVRDRVLYLLLAFALVIIGASRLLALLTVGSETRIVADTGLAAISFFGVLTAVFVGVSLLRKEIEQRTAQTVLVRPLSRAGFVAGKYAGLVLTLGVNGGVMSAGFLLLLAVRGDPIRPLLPALWLTGVELAVITAVALFFSSLVTSSILGMLCTLATYVSGHLIWSFPLLAERLESPFARGVTSVVSHLLPNLDRFNLRSEAVHGDPVSLAFVAAQTVYGIGWIALLVTFAAVAFSRRDLA